MDLNLSISNRQIKPSVVNLFQYENQTTTLTFTLDSYMYDQVNLSNYKAYAVTSINGQIDMTELGMSLVDGVLKLTWTLGEYSLSQSGALQYQIVFKETADDGENSAVFYSYKAIIIVRESVDADDHITANYPTLLKQWADRMSNLSSVLETGDSIIYMSVGESIDVLSRVSGKLYYQIENATTNEGHFEDHLGNVLTEPKVATYIENVDLNTLLTHGEYISGGTATNTPISCTYCMVRVTDSPSTNRIIQELYIPNLTDNTVRVFVRAVTGEDTFGEWKELASKNLGTANAAVITDANGDLTASSVVSVAELNYLNGVTSNIQTQLNNKAAGTDLTEHSDDTTAHITESERTTWNGKAPTSHASSATTYGVGNGSNYGHLKLSDSTSSTSAVSGGIAATPAAVKAAYDLANAKQDAITGAATTITGSNLTVSRALVSNTNGKVAVSAVTSTELGYLDGVTSNVQTQLNAKQAAITGAASTITGSNLTANMVMITDANGKATASSYITATELNALNGFITGGGTVQAQLNAKLYIPDYTAGVDLLTAVSDIRNTPYTIPSNGMIWAEALSTPNKKDAYLSFIINGTQVAGLHIGVGAPSYISGATSPYERNCITFPVKKGWTIKLGDNDVLGYSVSFFPYTYA